MLKIAYLLHRFPGITDTFIKREIRTLQQLGTDVQVISVWKPSDKETTPAELLEWSGETQFVLPNSLLQIAWIVFLSIARSPVMVLRTFWFAVSTARPGVRGILYQLAYYLEAMLASYVLRSGGFVHVHNHIGDQSGTVTMLAAKMAGIGYSITFHGWPVFFDAKNSRIKEKVENACFTRAISYFCRSQLMMFSNATDPAPFKVVHCGLNINNYKFRAPNRDIGRVFCVARLSPEKGHTFLLGALKILSDKGRRLQLLLAGDGPSRTELAKLADSLGISDRVTFLGFLNERQIIDELDKADLFVLPSFVEGVPVCVMEAMAVGVPVVATNVGGTGELIKDRKTGILIPPSDADAIADAVVEMIENYDFRLRSTKEARETIINEFDQTKETTKLHALLRAYSQSTQI
jgi:colanic acid/amylovoran biosynthesis glycosyltransferase